MENGTHVDAKDKDGKTSMQLACENCRFDVAKFLIQNGANVNCRDNVLEPRFGADGRKLLIERGCETINNANECENDTTPLLLACERGRTEMIQLSLSRGGGLTAETTQVSTPLYTACEEDHLEVVWLLVRQYPWLAAEPTSN